MFICEIWLFDWYFPQFCKSDVSKYGYLEVFQRVHSTSRYRESTVHSYGLLSSNFEKKYKSIFYLIYYAFSSLLLEKNYMSSYL